MQLFLFFKLLFYCDVLADIKNCFLFYLATGRTATCRLCTMVGKLGLSQAKRHHVRVALTLKNSQIIMLPK